MITILIVLKRFFIPRQATVANVYGINVFSLHFGNFFLVLVTVINQTIISEFHILRYIQK